ncbi:response regulator [Paraliomyxa miuraensis]|uniref:response regulator n=1 Tax=Paraliomyxa miuraensis TaxID=376150 RepID=UPI00225AC1BA|nr:response regulator [Paraliomyxa miuraensis]MCX4245792.1 response regulator [Paraliomyxa miuraensis]
MPDKVLVVEDSRAMRGFVSSILEATGEYEVIEVDNGFDALRALPRGDYVLIVTDVNMPDVSGIELTKFVRGNAKYKSIPVVVISTDSASKDLQRAKDAGASDFLAKPFTAEDLLAVIARARVAAAGQSSPGPGQESGDEP